MADNHDIILDEIKDLKRRIEYLEQVLMSRPVYIPYQSPVPWWQDHAVYCSGTQVRTTIDMVNKHC